LSTAIIHFFKTNKINVPVVAQVYDGASVMVGKFNGVQEKIQTEYPYAIYTHCMAHKLNLVVVNLCKEIKVFVLNIF